MVVNLVVRCAAEPPPTSSTLYPSIPRAWRKPTIRAEELVAAAQAAAARRGV
jgi:hypothetical protein